MIASLKLYLACLASLFILSCGKSDNNDSVKSAAGSDTLNKSVTKEVPKENFTIKYELVGKREGKMVMIRSNDKLKIEFDFESGGVKSINQFYLLNDTVYTVIRQGGSKVGSRTGFKNFKEAYTGNELVLGSAELSKYFENTKIKDKEKVLGYDCEIYELSDRTIVSVYNKKYMLRISKPLYQATATSLVIDQDISPDIFELPRDVEYYDKDKKVIKFGTKEDSIAYYNKK